MNKTLLVLINGCDKNWAAIEYTAWLAAKTGKTLRLEGIIENPAKKENVEAMLTRASQYLSEKGLKHSIATHTGNLEKTASQLSEEFPHAVFVAGNMGRSSLQKLISGSSFRNLMEAVHSPLLFVPTASIPVKKVLICMGGLKYALTAEHLGLKLAKEMDAQVTLLTVVPPIDLDYPEARVIREQWQTLAETDTEPGRNLRNALATARGLGVETNIRARNGNIVEEILDEIKTGQYQLICMGSSFSAQGLRHMMTANVTAEIAESRLCPVLSARYDATE